MAVRILAIFDWSLISRQRKELQSLWSILLDFQIWVLTRVHVWIFQGSNHLSVLVLDWNVKHRERKLVWMLIRYILIRVFRNWVIVCNLCWLLLLIPMGLQRQIFKALLFNRLVPNFIGNCDALKTVLKRIIESFWVSPGLSNRKYLWIRLIIVLCDHVLLSLRFYKGFALAQLVII